MGLETSAPPPLAARMEGIRKSFSGVPVLKGVDFELRRGEIHALVGGNGAGKSTLMKILAGVYERDGGIYTVNGQETDFRSVQMAQAAGVGMVFQEFSLVPTLTVAQNVYLNREPKHRGLIDDREMVRRARLMFEQMNVALDPTTPQDELSTAYWQLTEIAKALAQDARILILDEPTAALARTETEELFALMRRLRDQGISMTYISHRMEEIFTICDRVTVLRDGVAVMTGDVAGISPRDVIDAIVGRTLEHAMDYVARSHTDDVLLEAKGLETSDKLTGVDLTLRAGEVVGLAGLMGSGRSELVRALFGIDPITAGEVRVGGNAAHFKSPEQAIDAGLGLIPEDRRAQGLVLDHSVRANYLLPQIDRIGRIGFVDDREGDRRTDEAIGSLSIMLNSRDQEVVTLSGGNQQKVVIAKWLGTKPRILMMDEPTAGVDIGTKGEIVAMIREFADAGNAVLIISSELPELLAVSDRILVMRNGRVDREIPRSAIVREEDLHHAIQAIGAER
jgi:ribose transport system ATP-binding protein